ncbi:MAG: DNA internalization-related competence protein ComEC/Rec2 [Acidobacteria bacterium]|nr:DNA internalization-related competence protein ComEC/Rec2 [Acidobacteriota bacterium]
MSPVAGTPLPLLIFSLFLTLFAVWKSRYRRYYLPLLSLTAGVLTETTLRPGPPPELDAESGETVLLRGCVVEPPAMSESRAQFLLELEPGARVRVTKYLPDNDTLGLQLTYGQIVEFEARIRVPRNFGNPGSFDFKGYLARRNVYWTASISSSATISVLAGSCGNRAMNLLYNLRVALLRRVERLYSTDRYVLGMLEALLVGETARMERTWADEFRRTGTYHAIVVSGLHVTVIAAAIALLLRLFARHSWWVTAVTVAAVWIYAGMCGWQAPVLRSAAGYSLFAVGRYFHRRSRLLNLLAAIALLFLIAAPQQVSEASFQLTFFSVLALGALAVPAVEATSTPLRHGLADLGDEAKDAHLLPRAAAFRIEMRLIAETFWLLFRLPRRYSHAFIAIAGAALFWIWETLLVSVAIQIGLALPMIVYFHRMSISGVTANLIVTPLLTFAVPSGLLAVATSWGWPVWITGALVRAAGAVAAWHARWEPNWRVPDPPYWLAAAFLAALILLAVTRKRILLVPVLALLAILIWRPFAPQSSPGWLELTMLDVGQGEAMLIGFPDGKWMMVDAGGIPVYGKRPVPSRMEIGEDVVTPYLLSRGIRRIDIAVSTHQHDDHAQGLPAVMDNFRPRQLWTGATPESPVWRTLQRQAAKLAINIVSMHRSQHREIGGVNIDVLSPAPGYQPRNTASNNDSLVLSLQYGAHRFLLTGDAERLAEHAMLDALPRATVLKVGHHGSKTSTSNLLLDAVQPSFALISAGQDNPFRHPHAEVLQRLAERHTAVFRTDQWGLIRLRTNGQRLQVESSRWQNF